MPSEPNTRRRLVLAGGLALAAGPLVAAGERRPIEIGVLPYLPTTQLIAGHQSLRQFIEETFRRPAVLSSAPDFPTFHRRTLAGNYDLAITGSPLAWHAHKEGRMVWIAVSDRMLRVVFLVRTDAAITRLADLRGKTVATIAPMTIIAQVAAEALKAQNLTPGLDVILRYERTPFNTVQSVLLGEAAAAAFPDVSLPALPAEVRGQVRSIHQSEELPSIGFLARRATDMPDVETMRQALFRFVWETPQGQEFVRSFGHNGLHAPDLKAMHILDRYLPEIRRQMGQS